MGAGYVAVGDRMLVAWKPVWGTKVDWDQRSGGGVEEVDSGGNLREFGGLGKGGGDDLDG